jgi:hypothetical protein
MGKASVTKWEGKNAHRIFVAKFVRKRIGKYRSKLEVNVEKELREIAWSGLNWINLT